MAKETRFERNTLGAVLKRADALRLGDRIITINALGEVKISTVRSLALLGDDVEINGHGGLTTSEGNTFLVLD